ncbi:SDR family oxidoreductase [Planktomarina sp.]|nr:SDR family oxidoreductase [Planktomarina sp.]
MSIFNLTGKNIIVTGAARGNGLAMCRGISNYGACVIGVDRIPMIGHGFPSYELDITNKDAVKNFVAVCEGEFGIIDGLVNNAGVSIGSNDPHTEQEVYDETLNVNLNAVFRLTSLLCRHMALHGKGSIINITSLGAHQAFPLNPSYQISKAGLEQLTKAFACDWGPKGIRLNNICPGYIRTSMTESSFNDPVLNKQRRDRTMLDRWGKSEDLVGAAIFLLSDASSYVTGSTVFVDGGWTAKGF